MNPLISFEIHNHLKQIYKRRHMLRHTALEIFMYAAAGTDSVLWAFESTERRDTFHDFLLQKKPNHMLPESLEEVTRKWVNRDIDNFRYLMYLNLAADRTFNDLRQYPVFPWVLKDYTSAILDLNNREVFRDLSQPIGALNKERLELLLRRYEEMPRGEEAEAYGLGQPFLYGSHYSTPAYVIYFLIRSCPEYAIHLQNGRFEIPDRLFRGIAETWQGCMESPTDVKELIPEFFQPAGDFLVNAHGLDLGVTQRGERVWDVILPNWAADATEFINRNREALESDYVSQHLHEWIDLIFGYKQRGEEAEKAHNVFYHLTYEGAIDIDKVEDPHERESIMLQINEFGQCPKQLFTSPHPQRKVSRWVEVAQEVENLLSTVKEMRTPTSQSRLGYMGGMPSPSSVRTKMFQHVRSGKSSAYGTDPPSQPPASLRVCAWGWTVVHLLSG